MNKTVVFSKKPCYNFLKIGKGKINMKALTNGFVKFIVANLAIVAIIAMLPVFLLTSEVPIYNSLIDYLFGNAPTKKFLS